jgi:hypothetical protein
MVCQTQCEAARGEHRRQSQGPQTGSLKSRAGHASEGKASDNRQGVTARAYASALLTGSLPTGAGEPG